MATIGRRLWDRKPSSWLFATLKRGVNYAKNHAVKTLLGPELKGSVDAAMKTKRPQPRGQRTII